MVTAVSSALSLSLHDSSARSPLDELLTRHDPALPFDATVCRGRPGARARSAAYVWAQAVEFAGHIARAPLAGDSYRKLLEPWGLRELIPGQLYRSAEPRAPHFAHLGKLGIRTLVCVKRTMPRERTLHHARTHGITVVRIDLGADGHISPENVQRALDVLLRPALGPVLLHCDGGRHRTGIVTAALRHTQGWSLADALEEYERFASPTPRVSDGAAIARYFDYAGRAR